MSWPHCLTCRPCGDFHRKARDRRRADNDHTVARMHGISEGEFPHLLCIDKGMASKQPE